MAEFTIGTHTRDLKVNVGKIVLLMIQSDLLETWHKKYDLELQLDDDCPLRGLAGLALIREVYCW